VAVGAGEAGLGVLVGGPTVGGGGSVGVGGTGGVVGSGVDVGSGGRVGLASTVGVAVKVGTKVLVGVTVGGAIPIRPPRDGPRSIAVDAPRTQTRATARITTRIVSSLLLINLSLRLTFDLFYRDPPTKANPLLPQALRAQSVKFRSDVANGSRWRLSPRRPDE